MELYSHISEYKGGGTSSYHPRRCSKHGYLAKWWKYICAAGWQKPFGSMYLLYGLAECSIPTSAHLTTFEATGWKRLSGMRSGKWQQAQSGMEKEHGTIQRRSTDQNWRTIGRDRQGEWSREQKIRPRLDNYRKQAHTNLTSEKGIQPKLSIRVYSE